MSDIVDFPTRRKEQVRSDGIALDCTMLPMGCYTRVTQGGKPDKAKAPVKEKPRLTIVRAIT
jgi:hypothetical protein